MFILVIGCLALGAGFATLINMAFAKPSVRECLEICKAADAGSRAFYAHDGACLCMPPCPTCAVCAPVAPEPEAP